MSDQLMNILEEEASKESRMREAIGQYLMSRSNREGSVMAFLGRMAGSISFTCTRTLKWVASDVKLAVDLPFLAALKDPETGEIVIDADNIDLIRQRPVDWSRQLELARYLISEPLHQFPPLLLVITSSWAEDPSSEMWVNGRAIESTFEYEKFGAFDGQVELSLDPRKYLIYALDGQHRVVGIRGALEMINTSFLQPKNKVGNPTGHQISIDEWIDTSVITRAEVDLVPSETIGVQLIPGVIKGETMEEARRRIATVFVHVNQTAAPLRDGDLTQIDRNDGFAHVARTLATHNAFLKKYKRVNFSNNTISSRSVQITTLTTLKTSAKMFLQEYPMFAKWDTRVGRGRVVARRPAEDEIKLACDIMNDIWNRISMLPCFAVLETDPEITVPQMRNFTADDGKAHMFYRPIGQQALIAALALVILEMGDTDKVFAMLAQVDRSGGFRLDDVCNPWYGVLYNDSLGKMVVAGQKLATRILEYMLVGTSADKREALLRDFAEARKSREGFAWDIDGSEVAIDKVRLPAQVTLVR